MLKINILIRVLCRWIKKAPIKAPVNNRPLAQAHLPCLKGGNMEVSGTFYKNRPQLCSVMTMVEVPWSSSRRK